jgi:thiamine pyrophosphate-dependent acetolactate synthase large subunit-like protein
VKIADACGVEAVRTANPGELSEAAHRAVERNRSLVIAVPVDYRDSRRLF